MDAARYVGRHELRDLVVVGFVESRLLSPNEMTGDAWAAMARQDWDEALRLWRQLREDFPDRPDYHVWPIHAYTRHACVWKSSTFSPTPPPRASK